jgi:hypothetical protein
MRGAGRFDGCEESVGVWEVRVEWLGCWLGTVGRARSRAMGRVRCVGRSLGSSS